MSAPTTSPGPAAAEARQVDKILKADMLRLDARYCVVSMGWWRAWCEFSGFGRAEDPAGGAAVPGPEPGPIPNDELRSAEHPRELRPQLTEDYDFKILPEQAYSLLAAAHGETGERFERYAIPRSAEGGPAGEVLVELYPIRCVVEIVGADGHGAGPDASGTLLVSRRDRVSVVHGRIAREAERLEKARLGNEGAILPLHSRLWYLKVDPQASDGDAALVSRPSASNSNAPSGGNSEAETDSDGYVVLPTDADAPAAGPAASAASAAAADALARRYALFERTSGASGDGSMLSLLDAGPAALHVLAEYRRSSTDPWPRDLVLDAWKLRLAPGQECDARDDEGAWYESVVCAVREGAGGRLEAQVHFLGWSARWNLWLCPSDARDAERLARRNERVPHWRSLLAGDEVEVRDPQSPDHKPVWFQGKVLHVAPAPEGGWAAPPAPPAGLALPAATPPSEADLALGGKLLLVRQTSSSAGFCRWASPHGELLCRVGTHLKAKAHRAAPAGGALAPPRPYAPYGGGGAGQRGRPAAPGCVGLRNLGNTCFMNSMLQCLSHTPPLTRAFLDGVWRAELNRSNPLGTQGKLAAAYADFIRDVWGGDHTVVAPVSLKRTVGAFNSAFAGYAQQDSQELMSFLLDGLHEDLNRRTTKPYTEQVESNGRPDGEVAAEQWRRHLLRNDSVVVDHCHGLLRSHLTCNECGHDSITFDPYLSLSLPLPVKASRRVDAVLVRHPPSRPPLRLRLELDARASFADARRSLAALSGADAARLVLADVWQHRVHANLSDDAPLAELRDGDELWAFELRDVPPERLPAAAEPPPGGEGPADDRRWTFGGMMKGRGSGRRGKRPDVGAEAYVDVLLAEERRGRAGFGAKLEHYGVPLRLSCADGETNAQVHAAAREALGRLAGEAVAGGYRLLCTPQHAYSLANAEEVPDDGAAFLPRAARRQALALVLDAALRERVSDARIEEDVEEHPSCADKAGRGGGGGGIALGDCFAQLMVREQLSESDMWYCGSCKKHVRAYKKLDLWSAPDVLILHLKRFQYLPGTYFVHRQKLEQLVDFPLESLDMAPFVKGPPPDAGSTVYDLYAVSEHSGGLGGGHYTAVARNTEGLEGAPSGWYAFNDSSAGKTTAERVVSPRAYVLFYRRRGASVRWGGLEPAEGDAA